MADLWQAVLAAVVSGGVVSGAVTGGFGVLKSNADIDQQNVALVLKMHQDSLNTNPEEAAVYAALMVDGKLVPRDLGCNLIGLALFTGKATPAIISAVRSALRPDLIAKSFASPPCDLQSYADNPTPTPTPEPDPSPTPQKIDCPIGRLYTQFGTEAQRTFGINLQSSLNKAHLGGEVQAPEVVKGFDAKNPVIRYFFTEMQDGARNWQSLLESVLPGIDVKYAYVPGYEPAIGAAKKETFELWWPASMAVPAQIGAPVCTPPALS